MKDVLIKPIPVEFVTHKILLIRGQKVMLDSDLAEFYQVPTMRLNEQVKRNTDRFPTDFVFRLSPEETSNLNLSQFAMGSQKHRDPRFSPYAFTEHGVLMLSAVLKSQRAAEVSILIVRAFVRLREILSSNKELGFKVSEIEREQVIQNRHINAIYRILDKLISEPDKPKECIGFRRN